MQTFETATQIIFQLHRWVEAWPQQSCKDPAAVPLQPLNAFQASCMLCGRLALLAACCAGPEEVMLVASKSRPWRQRERLSI
jgi:hypothetical protein